MKTLEEKIMEVLDRTDNNDEQKEFIKTNIIELIEADRNNDQEKIKEILSRKLYK